MCGAPQNSRKTKEKKMKKFALFSVLITVVFLSAWRGASQAQNVDEAAARVPLENYLKGHATGDGDYMRKAFHPEAKVFSFRDGKLNQLTSAEFAARFTGGPAPDEAQRKRWIESVKITGNAGVGVIVLDYPTVKFTDYMSLLKVDGEWKIINKTFDAAPKTKP
jgi:Putative lumazine-binding